MRYADIQSQFERHKATYSAESDTMEAYRERIASLKEQLEKETQKGFENKEKLDATELQLKNSMKKQLELEDQQLSDSQTVSKSKHELEEERQLRISREIEIAKLKQEFEHVKTGICRLCVHL